MDKKRSAFRSILVIDHDQKQLKANAKLLKELNIAETVAEFTSGKEALDFLMLMKQFPGKGGDCPDLLLVDTDFPYFEKRNFLNDLLLLYPEKKNRPGITLTWKNKEPKKHFAADLVLEQPLNKEKAERLVKKKN